MVVILNRLGELRWPGIRWLVKWWIRIAMVVLFVHVFLYLTSKEKSIVFALPVSVLFAAGVGGLGIADARWRSETLFLGSLGISPGMIGLTWGLSALAMEGLLSLAIVVLG